MYSSEMLNQTDFLNLFRREYRCPISNVLMKSPVIDMDGVSYEKQHIENWFQGNSVSPVTHMEMISKELVDNRTLEDLIKRTQNEIPKLFTFVKTLNNKIQALVLENERLRQELSIRINAQKEVIFEIESIEEKQSDNQMLFNKVQYFPIKKQVYRSQKSQRLKQQIEREMKKRKKIIIQTQNQPMEESFYKISKRKIIKKHKFQRYYDNQMGILQEKVKKDEQELRQKMEIQCSQNISKYSTKLQEKEDELKRMKDQIEKKNNEIEQLKDNNEDELKILKKFEQLKQQIEISLSNNRSNSKSRQCQNQNNSKQQQQSSTLFKKQVLQLKKQNDELTKTITQLEQEKMKHQQLLKQICTDLEVQKQKNKTFFEVNGMAKQRIKEKRKENQMKTMNEESSSEQQKNSHQQKQRNGQSHEAPLSNKQRIDQIDSRQMPVRPSIQPLMLSVREQNQYEQGIIASLIVHSDQLRLKNQEYQVVNMQLSEEINSLREKIKTYEINQNDVLKAPIYHTQKQKNERLKIVEKLKQMNQSWILILSAYVYVIEQKLMTLTSTQKKIFQQKLSNRIDSTIKWVQNQLNTSNSLQIYHQTLSTKMLFTKIKYFGKQAFEKKQPSLLSLYNYSVNILFENPYKSQISYGHQISLLTIQSIKRFPILQGDLSWDQINSIRVENSNLNNSEWRSICEMGNKFPNLVQINVKNNIISQITVQNLKKFKNLREINLVGNPLNSKSIQGLKLYQEQNLISIILF